MSTETAVARGVLDSLLASLAQAPGSLAPTTLEWLKALRAQALERVGALTLPTPHDEAWRFTNISALTRQSFHPLRTPTALQAGDIKRFHIEEATTRLVFVDGVHAPQLSSITAEAGVVVSTLLSAPATQTASMAAHLGQHAPFHDALFPALNTAVLHDAAVVIVPRETSVATPVHLLFLSTQPDLASHPRVLLVAESGSAVTVIEDYAALHDGAYFTNALAEVVLAANAQVEHIRVQRESGQAFHMASCAVSLGAASRYHSVSIALGAQISRLDLSVAQTADAAECSLDGLALIGAEHLADTHTFIDHAKPHGVSRQLHKCIVGGAAHAVFNGQVMVRPGAQKTDSAQSSRNLLLSGKAQVDTQPQLEIFADDVKCTHGATVGQLDSEEVFYLQSRGLSERVARNLLTYAFGAEVINRIPVASLRRQLEQTVLEQTTGQP
ncbi:Fe-S cluster assembly protein SufD [Rhodoferax ferrireducens]|uniref:Fe-S cluster assembly protein SufD n=1 Tax=Rhodoferax ferrireducens TaxID=192843 RepID=UPI003BB74B08